MTALPCRYAVYGCVRILAEAIAGLPLNVYQYRSDGSKEKLYSHSLYHLLHDEPNPEMTSFIFRETMMSHLLLHGNAYAQIIRNGRGEVVALYPLLPNKMDVSRENSGRLYYTYTRNSDEPNGRQKFEQVVLPREDVLHISGPGFDGLIGYSPIAMAKKCYWHCNSHRGIWCHILCQRSNTGWHIGTSGNC